ncbi:MAG: transposase [Saprospiraceae bacterium]|nr:transposase [Saprospiraceae bacterium]
MKRYTEAERRSWIDQYRASGLPVSQFCADNGLIAGNMYNWLSKQNGTPINKSKFVEVVPKVKPEQALYIIQYPNGVEVRIMSKISNKELLELIFA